MLLWRSGLATCPEVVERPDAHPVEYERKAHVTQNKPIALWTVPRSISTAFERVFVEREDFKVFHEPFSVSYYYSTERSSDRYAEHEPKEEYRYEKVLAEILAPHEKPVFFKDMAYYVAGFMTPE